MKRVLLILSVTLGSILLVTYLLSYGPIWYANHLAKVWDRTQHRWIQVFNWNRTNSNIQDDLWNAMLKMDPGCVARRVEIQGGLERRAGRRSSRDCLGSSPPQA
jgi:hypothetical protein